ncbi:hypothetical protein P879_04272 [Paragonimus westermani]|uniref:Uncharacterized protein n=1 Tax=Paragonimus westermani TaxID=34504 RepID=A0A8T0DR45_9TREM|nr:hypothetical protein P879_04272 [Paragonimus westermani]
MPDNTDDHKTVPVQFCCSGRSQEAVIGGSGVSIDGEVDHKAVSTLSFATCVRENCRAEMWGCNIKKRHSGFLSKEEKEEIIRKEKMNRGKPEANPADT